MNLQSKIRALMEERGWTVYRLAKESGVSWSTIRNMFDRNTEPTVPTVEALCKGLGITLEELLLGEGFTALDDEQKDLRNRQTTPRTNTASRAAQPCWPNQIKSKPCKKPEQPTEADHLHPRRP